MIMGEAVLDLLPHRGGGCGFLHRVVQVAIDIDIQMAHETLGVTLGTCGHYSALKSPPHDVMQHRGPRLTEACGKLIHLRPRHLVETGIHADAGAWLSEALIWRVHTSPFNQGL